MVKRLKRAIKKLAGLESALVRATSPRAMAEALVGAPSPLVGAGSTPLDLTGMLVGVPARFLASPGALFDPAREKLGRFMRPSRADEHACLSAFLLWRADECRGQESTKIHAVGDVQHARVQSLDLFGSCALSMVTGFLVFPKRETIRLLREIEFYLDDHRGQSD